MSSFDRFYEKYAQELPDNSLLMAELNAMMEACFLEFPKLNAIILYGWTPGFNDGEPCEHSSEFVLFFNDIITGDGLIIDMLDDEFGYALKEDNEFTAEEIVTAGHNLDIRRVSPEVDSDDKIVYSGDKKIGSDVARLVTLISSQPLSDQIWRTNYSTLVVRNSNSGVDVSHKKYDCGW